MTRPISAPITVLAMALVLLAAVAITACGPDSNQTRPAVTLLPAPTSTPETPEASDPVRTPTRSADGSAPGPSRRMGSFQRPTLAARPTATAGAPGASTPTEAFTPTPLNADDLGHLPDDPTDLMFAAMDSSLADVGRKMAYSHNDAFIPVLMELMRFQPDQETVLLIASYLVRIRDEIPREEISIVPSDQDRWGYWQEWLARNPDVRAPGEFDRWKGILFSLIDPRIGAFMYSGVPATIRLEEIVWGGVRRDGIPDLRFPPAISPGQATYLKPGDRVFGVSINGEHRAYPLRVLNAHEMANDILGGVQFALAY